jgi:hypothetical protein
LHNSLPSLWLHQLVLLIDFDCKLSAVPILADSDSGIGPATQNLLKLYDLDFLFAVEDGVELAVINFLFFDLLAEFALDVAVFSDCIDGIGLGVVAIVEEGGGYFGDFVVYAGRVGMQSFEGAGAGRSLTLGGPRPLLYFRAVIGCLVFLHDLSTYERSGDFGRIFEVTQLCLEVALLLFCLHFLRVDAVMSLFATELSGASADHGFEFAG